MKSRDVKLIISTSLILFCQVFVGYTQGNVYTIERNRYWSPITRIMYSWDSITIPTSICNVTSTDHGGCGLFDAVLDSSRSCSCSCQLTRNTLAFQGNKWRCVNNNRVIDLQDCTHSTLFYGEERNPSVTGLTALDITDTLYFTAIPYGGPFGWQMCEVNINSSWYLGCNGSRVRSSQHLRIMKDLFSFTTRSGYSLFILQLNSQVKTAELLKGKIINLGIQCTDPNKAPYQGCLMFKLLGQQKCNVAATNSRTTPTLQPSAITTISDAALAPTTTLDITQTTSSVQRSPRVLAISSTVTSQPSTFDKSFVTASTTASASLNVPLSPNSGLEQSTEKGLSSLGLIAGITGSIALLVIMIVGSLIYRRRYYSKKLGVDASSTKRNNQDVTTKNPRINLAFKSDDDNNYKEFSINTEEPRDEPEIYASTYNVLMRPVLNDCPDSGHIYAALEEDLYDDVYDFAQTQESFYCAVEKPNTDIPLQNYGPNGMDQPVYKVQEKPSPAKGPVGTSHNGADPIPEGERCSREYANIPLGGPSCNTLLESYSVGFKEANCNEPVYNVLEDSVPGEAGAPEQSGAMTAAEPLYNTVEPDYCPVYIYGASCKS